MASKFEWWSLRELEQCFTKDGSLWSKRENKLLHAKDDESNNQNFMTQVLNDKKKIEVETKCIYIKVVLAKSCCSNSKLDAICKRAQWKHQFFVLQELVVSPFLRAQLPDSYVVLKFGWNCACK